jgi:DNA-directed RNA polymerase subunit alpha
MDDPSARLSVEFHVQRGTGYQPANGRDERETIGLLPIDAIFTPTRKVNFDVENTRIGQVTDFERLVLEVWTDETLGPDEAVRQAAQILVDHFSYFALLGRPTAVIPERRALVAPVSDDTYNTAIDELKLSSRTMNCLRRGSISTIGDVLERTPQELLALRNFGERSLEELYGRLQAIGIPVDLEEARGRRPATDANAAEEQPETGESPEAEQEETVLRAYSAGAEEDEELEEAPPTVGRTFYPD